MNLKPRWLHTNGTRNAAALSAACAIVAALAACTDSSSTNVRFDRIVLDTEQTGDCKAIADVDADGRVDLIVGGAALVWYRNPGWESVEIARAETEFTTDCQAVDLNDDGRVDVVTGDGKDGDNVVWFENLGASGWTRHTIGSHGTWVHDLEVADFDGDGRLDVLTHGHGTRIWYRTADDDWVAQGLGAPDKTIEGIGIGDLNDDGRVDIVQGGWWYENPGQRNDIWTPRQFADGYDGGSFTAVVADLDRDGQPEVTLAAQHDRHELAWFKAPSDASRPWQKHVLGELGAHKLQIADVNADGYPDLVVGLELEELRVYVSDGATPPQFVEETINTTGCHNTRVGDVNGDRLVDILCANYLGHPPVELWLNRTTAPEKAGGWQYIRVDDSRTKLESGWPAFGLAFGDIDRDGRTDIVSGKYFYKNPGGRLTGRWTRSTFPVDADAMLVLDVDDDGQLDVIAESLPTLYWLKPNLDASQWTARPIANLPATTHRNGQGYRIARIVPEDLSAALVLTTGDGVWIVRVPPAPAAVREWPASRIATGTSEDLLATGDIDGDGLVDVVASDGTDGRSIRWYRNPGVWSGTWESHDVGEATDWADRAEVADIDGDGRLDIVVATENSKPDGAATYWFRAPVSRSQPWERHTVAVQGSSNSLAVGDLDGGSTLSIVTGEHKGELRVRVWTSQDGGESWHDTLVDSGKESHLGTQLADLDGDGALDIVSIAWDDFAALHLWRNDTRLALDAPGHDSASRHR